MNPRSLVGRLAALAVGLLFVSASLRAQTATQYSDKDKQKLAEIAQRPEVRQRIQEAWDTRRRNDMEYAFTVNQSTRLAQLNPTALAEFRQHYGELYDNPILVRYVNALGQKIVPNGSPNLYSFRLLLDPVPRAEALTTGTVYISTGLVSLLDNEAQLAYILGHEIAHVEKQHAYNEIRNEILEEEFNQEKEQEVQKKRTIFSAVAAGAGAAVGARGGTAGALAGAAIGFGGGSIAAGFIFRNHFQPTEWSTIYEDEADEAGLKYMLEKSFDAREIPRLYARLDNLVARDSREGLGFIGSPARTKERESTIQRLLTGAYKADLEAKMKAGLIGSGPDFALLMSALKRDNGVVSLDYDLYAIARDNLEEAANLRSNDPRVHYYLGQVIAMTARAPADKQQAIKEFTEAIKYDADRGAYPEPHLEQALFQISQNDPGAQEQVKSELKTYVALYQRQHSGALPGNMYIIYDYFLLVGDRSWYVPPAAIVSTKNVDALFVTNVSAAPSTATQAVVSRALGEDTGSGPATKPMPAEAPKAVKKTAGKATTAPPQ